MSLLEVLLFSRIRSIYPKDNGLINVRWKLITIFLWNTSPSLFQYRAVSLYGKPYFLFPDVLKRWSFQKNSAGIWSFLYYRERWYFAPAHDLSCIICKDGIFSRKHDLFSLGRKWKTGFPRKYMETWCIAQRRKTGNLIYRAEVCRPPP